MPKTLAQMKTLLSGELDLETEDFIQPDELTGYFNHAIREAEAHILKLGLKDMYLKKKGYISLVSGTDTYDLPIDLYANKIIKVVYRNGAVIYDIKPMDVEGERRYVAEEVINLYQALNYYKYDVVDGTDGTSQLKLFPPAQETLANAVALHYYRDANTLVDDTDICDLPEIAYEFIHARVKVYCYEKESHTNLPLAQADLQKMEALMIATLEQQLVDSDANKMNQDFSHYEEST
jgi:hypothetical protein